MKAEDMDDANGRTSLPCARTADEMAAVLAMLIPVKAAGYPMFPLRIGSKIPRDVGWGRGAVISTLRPSCRRRTAAAKPCHARAVVHPLLPRSVSNRESSFCQIPADGLSAPRGEGR